MESAFRCEFSDNASAIFPAATGVKFVAFSRLQSELNLAARTESSETVSNLTDSGISAGRLIVIISVVSLQLVLFDDFFTTIAFSVVICVFVCVCCDQFFFSQTFCEKQKSIFLMVYDPRLMYCMFMR